MSIITSLFLFIIGTSIFVSLPNLAYGTKYYSQIFHGYLSIAFKSVRHGVLLDQDNGPWQLNKVSRNDWGLYEFEYNDQTHHKEDHAGLTKQVYGAHIGLTRPDTMTILSPRVAESLELVQQKANAGDLGEYKTEKERTEELKRDVVRTKERLVEPDTTIQLPKENRLVDLSYAPRLLRRFTEPVAPNVTEAWTKESQAGWKDMDTWQTISIALMFIVGAGGVVFANEIVGGGGGSASVPSVPIPASIIPILV